MSLKSAELRKAMEADVQQFFIDSTTPDRGYPFPIDHTAKLIESLLKQARADTYRHAAELCRVKAELHSNPDLADCHEQDAVAIEQRIKELEGR